MTVTSWQISGAIGKFTFELQPMRDQGTGRRHHDEGNHEVDWSLSMKHNTPLIEKVAFFFYNKLLRTCPFWNTICSLHVLILSFSSWQFPPKNLNVLSFFIVCYEKINHSTNSLRCCFFPLFIFQINKLCFALGSASFPTCVLLTKVVWRQIEWIIHSYVV